MLNCRFSKSALTPTPIHLTDTDRWIATTTQPSLPIASPRLSSLSSSTVGTSFLTSTALIINFFAGLPFCEFHPLHALGSNRSLMSLSVTIVTIVTTTNTNVIFRLQ